MKKSLVYLLLLLCLHHFSVAQDDGFCGTKLQPNYIQWRNSILNTQNLVTTLPQGVCLKKKFSIAFHIVLDSNYTWGGLAPADLNACVSSLNAAFSPICVEFTNCFTDLIPNYTYNHWYMAATETSIAASYNMENVINIYAVDSIVGFPAGYAGGVIVVEKSSLVGGVTIHEMGHFFGLPHTWAEIGSPDVNSTPATTNAAVGSLEFVRRIPANCYNHGDGFCDTEADCYPADYSPTSTMPCKHDQGGAVDGWGDYYVPPVDNYMTYFKCGCRFTQEQYNFMAMVMVTQKLYLH